MIELGDKFHNPFILRPSNREKKNNLENEKGLRELMISKFWTFQQI